MVLLGRELRRLCANARPWLLLLPLRRLLDDLVDVLRLDLGCRFDGMLRELVLLVHMLCVFDILWFHRFVNINDKKNREL